MIIEPRMRGFICLTAHPKGCAQNVKNQINYIKSKGAIDGAKRVLVIGASTGFGLASRITAAFGSNASTIGVFFEKPPSDGKTASPGWYNSASFENEAKNAGLYAKALLYLACYFTYSVFHNGTGETAGCLLYPNHQTRFWDGCD